MAAPAVVAWPSRALSVSVTLSVAYCHASEPSAFSLPPPASCPFLPSFQPSFSLLNLLHGSLSLKRC